MSRQEKLRHTKFDPNVLVTKDSNNDLYKHWLRGERHETWGFCIICEQRISCENKGTAAFNQHARSASHQQKALKHRNDEGTLKDLSCKGQRLLSFKPEVNWNSYKDRPLTDTCNVTFAETVWATATATCSLPFNLADTFSPMFAYMFPDSAIAEKFSCRRVKTSYILSDGLGPHIRSLVENEVRNSAPAYTAIIDETTTVKHWRQFDILIRYWSESTHEIVVQHLKSFTLGKATSDHLLSCLTEALTPLYLKKLLQIASDGPNVMKALQRKAKELLNDHMVYIGTCNIHIVHNAFFSALEVLHIDVDTFAIDVYYIFKYSAARREDYEKVQDELDLTKHHVFKRHVNSRWLTFGASNERLLEELPALRKFFGKMTNKERQKCRIQRVCTALADKTLEPTMLFLKSVTGIFQRFERMFQAEGPLIHILYVEMNGLIQSILRRFLKAEVANSASGNKLLLLDLDKRDNQLKRPEVGLDADSLMKTLRERKAISELQYKEFYMKACEFLKTAAKQLIRKLPITNQTLHDLQALHPLLRTDPASFEKSIACVKRLCINVCGFMSEDKVDAVIDEFKIYLIHDIPEKWYILSHDDELVNDGDLSSDEDSDEVGTDGKVINYARIDHYFHKVFQLKNENGQPLFTSLPQFVKICLSFSHGSADVERGFSENSRLLSTSRTRLCNETVSSVRSVSSYMKRFKNIPQNIPFNKPMMTAVRKSWENYSLRKEMNKREKLKRRADAQQPVLEEMTQNNPNANGEKIVMGEKLLQQASNDMAEAVKNKDWAKVEVAKAVMDRANELLRSGRQFDLQKKRPKKK